MKSIRISAINWAAKFEPSKGSYYDKVAEIYSASEEKDALISSELHEKGWREIQCSDSLLRLYENDRHLIRVYRIWG